MFRALPWIAILLIIGAVQWIRDAPVDAVLFAVVALLVTLDAAGVLPELPALPLRFAGLAAVAALGVLTLLLAPRHGLLAGIVVVAIGLAAVIAAWPGPGQPSRGRARRVLRGAVLWASVTVALCLWELSSFLLGRFDAKSKLAHPAISDLLDPLIDTWPGRAAFVVGWIAAGAGLVWVGRRR
jgi:hypothetical protein